MILFVESVSPPSCTIRCFVSCYRSHFLSILKSFNPMLSRTLQPLCFIAACYCLLYLLLLSYYCLRIYCLNFYRLHGMFQSFSSSNLDLAFLPALFFILCSICYCNARASMWRDGCLIAFARYCYRMLDVAGWISLDIVLKCSIGL